MVAARAGLEASAAALVGRRVFGAAGRPDSGLGQPTVLVPGPFVEFDNCIQHHYAVHTDSPCGQLRPSSSYSHPCPDRSCSDPESQRLRCFIAYSNLQNCWSSLFNLHYDVLYVRFDLL